MADDNWSDRSTFECGTCMWFIAKSGPTQRVQPSAPADVRENQAVNGKGLGSVKVLGRCRRHAPVAGGHGWPAVYATDWCGDHKIRP